MYINRNVNLTSQYSNGTDNSLLGSVSLHYFSKLLSAPDWGVRGHMESTVQNAKEKFDEASFYLDLMDTVEIKRSALTKNRSAEQEFSYLLSAFLNACYSVTEHLKSNALLVSKIKEFRSLHPVFYSSSHDGGLRNQSTHLKPVKPAHDGYIPPPGSNVILRFRSQGEPYIPPAPGEPINLNFSSGSFYLSTQSQQNSICDLCAVHLGEIKKFIEQCEAL